MSAPRKSLSERVSEINQQAMDIADYLCSRGDTMPLRGQVEAEARRMLHALAHRGWIVARADLVPQWQPKVKPLEWRRSDQKTAFARCRYFSDRRYCIEHRLHGDDFDLWIGPDATRADRFGSLEAAKAAAQADYERRILSALDTPPEAD